MLDCPRKFCDVRSIIMYFYDQVKVCHEWKVPDAMILKDLFLCFFKNSFFYKKTTQFPEDKDKSDIDSDKQESELVEIPVSRASSTFTTLL